MKDLAIGVDVGTQSTKVLLVDVASGEVLARSAKSHGLIEGLADGVAEQHPHTWRDAVIHGLGELRKSPSWDATRLLGIGVSGQQHGLVALDAEGQVIRAAKLWCDTETAPEAAELSQAFGRQVSAGFTAPKILWLKRHEPEHFARLAHVLLPHDYINQLLTGRCVAECGDASGTGLFDPERRQYRMDDARHIDPKLEACLPPLVAPDQPIGAITPEAAEAFGLPAGLPVAPGGGDNMLSAIGSGAIEPGIVVASLGTSGTVFTQTTSAMIDPEGLVAPFCDSTGQWLPLVCVMNCTGVTELVCQAFGTHDLESLTREASEVPMGAEGLLFVPFVQGERTPDLPQAKGSLHGIGPANFRPATLFRAALEGISLGLYFGARRFQLLGQEIASLRIVGGGAQNALWRQILADVFEVPVQPLAEHDTAALGAALQAAWVTGHDTLPNLTNRAVRMDAPACDPTPGSEQPVRQLCVDYAKVLERDHGVVLR